MRVFVEAFVVCCVSCVFDVLHSGREKEGQEVGPRARDLDHPVCGGGAVTLHVSPSRRRLLEVGNREGAAGGRRFPSLKKGATRTKKKDARCQGDMPFFG